MKDLFYVVVMALGTVFFVSGWTWGRTRDNILREIRDTGEFRVNQYVYTCQLKGTYETKFIEAEGAKND